MEDMNNVPGIIEHHLKELLPVIGNEGLVLDELKKIWIEKENLFEKQTRSLGMVHIEEFPADDAGAAILPRAQLLRAIEIHRRH